MQTEQGQEYVIRAVEYAHWQEAVNRLAEAEHARWHAMLRGSDRDIERASQGVADAGRAMDLLTARALTQAVNRLAGTPPKPATPTPLADDDDFDMVDAIARVEAQEAADEARPPVEHRTDRPGQTEALCGRPMSESVGGPLGKRCADCDAVLSGRLGTVTSSSPTFR